jgi:hypothetical protein
MKKNSKYNSWKEEGSHDNILFAVLSVEEFVSSCTAITGKSSHDYIENYTSSH